MDYTREDGSTVELMLDPEAYFDCPGCGFQFIDGDSAGVCCNCGYELED